MAKQYPSEVRERAVRLVPEHREDYQTEYEATRSIATPTGRRSGQPRLHRRAPQPDLGGRLHVRGRLVWGGLRRVRRGVFSRAVVGWSAHRAVAGANT